MEENLSILVGGLLGCEKNLGQILPKGNGQQTGSESSREEVLELI